MHNCVYYSTSTLQIPSSGGTPCPRLTVREHRGEGFGRGLLNAPRGQGTIGVGAHELLALVVPAGKAQGDQMGCVQILGLIVINTILMILGDT